MTRRFVSLLFVLTFLPVGIAGAQDQPAAPQPGGPLPVAKTRAPTVRLEIVLARYADKKRIASEPYELLLVADGQQKLLRTGAEVPVALSLAGGKENSGGYKSIGTQITSDVTLYDDGRFRTKLMITSSSVYPNAQKQAERSAFRTFMLMGDAFLRSGETVEIASATDSLTGEVIKAEVTVRPVK